ncbi:MAG: AAA family ATPase [Myxococcales bacterium]|nr:AAA family ATPase [Myxococcales bacterium]
MLRLRRVHIRRFRSVAPDTKLEFGPGAVFLLGRNGSGKSTLLDLLGCLISCDFSTVYRPDEELDVEWESEWSVPSPLEGVSRLHLRLRIRPHGIDIPEVEASEALSQMAGQHEGVLWSIDGWISPLLPMPDAPPRDGDGEAEEWRLPTRIDFAASSRSRLLLDDDKDGSGIWTAAPDEPALNPWLAVEVLRRLIVRFDLKSQEVKQRGVGLRFVEMAYNARDLHRYDEALMSFEAIVGRHAQDMKNASIVLSRNHIRASYVPHQLVPGWYRDGVAEVTSRNFPADRSGNYLAMFADMVSAKSIDVTPRLSERKEGGASQWRGFDFWVQWDGGVTHQHDHLSFGQKRLLAFLWHISTFVEVPVLTDELTNGMHADWVSRIIDMLDGRQAFHAIQNPLLLNMSGLGQEGEIPRDFVFCSVETTEVGRTWRWRNPTPDEAREVRGAWEIGFQQLSDILLSRGMW